MLYHFVTITIMRYYNKTASPWQVGRKSAAGRVRAAEVMVIVIVTKNGNIGYWAFCQFLCNINLFQINCLYDRDILL